MDDLPYEGCVKRESADVKCEGVDCEEIIEHEEHLVEELPEDTDVAEVRTVVLQNIRIEETGEEIPVVLDEYSESTCDGNIHIDNLQDNIIHTYIINNAVFPGQEIVYAEDSETDPDGTVHYVIAQTEFDGSERIVQYDEAMEYYEECEEIIDDPSQDDYDLSDGVLAVDEDVEEQESLVEIIPDQDHKDEVVRDQEQDNKDEIVRFEDIKKEDDHVQCDICDKTFRTTAGLKRHVTVNHGNKDDGDDPLTLQLCPCCGEPSDTGHETGDFKCDQCEKFFQQESFLYRHISLEHPQSEIYVCFDCKKKFESKSELSDHMRIHPARTVKCTGCNREFSRKYHLDRHVGQTGCMGLPKKVYDCRVCKRVFSRKDNLAEHLRAHAGQGKKKKKYACEVCKKEFQGYTMLAVHSRTHTGEKPYGCDLCPKHFPSSGAMKKHRRMHTGERPYRCEKCDRTFSAKETLNRHWRTHTGEKPHTCEFCGKAFIQPSQLRAHIFHHTGENAYTCPHCGRAFNRKLRLTTHIKFMHEGAAPLPCPKCEKTFFRKEDVARHMLSHTGEKPYMCSICGKPFAVKSSLKIHQLTHRKEPPCSCDTCGRAFIRQDCLMRHIRARHRDVLEDIVANAEKKRLQQQLLNAAADACSKSRLTDNVIWNELTLTESIKELLTLLVDEDCLNEFGYPDAPVDKVLDSVIKRCGHVPASDEDFDYIGRIRENAKLLFTVVIDDEAVKELLNNQTVDEVIMHVLRLAKNQKEN